MEMRKKILPFYYRAGRLLLLMAMILGSTGCEKRDRLRRETEQVKRNLDSRRKELEVVTKDLLQPFKLGNYFTASPADALRAQKEIELLKSEMADLKTRLETEQALLSKQTAELEEYRDKHLR